MRLLQGKKLNFIDVVKKGNSKSAVVTDSACPTEHTESALWKKKKQWVVNNQRQKHSEVLTLNKSSPLRTAVVISGRPLDYTVPSQIGLRKTKNIQKKLENIPNISPSCGFHP